MCEHENNVRPLGGAVISVDGLNLFEVALFATDDIVPGEIPLTQRFILRFGKDNVELRKDGPATTVIQIISEPVVNRRGLDWIRDFILAATTQHFGYQIVIDVHQKVEPLCRLHRRTQARTKRVPA